MKEVQLVCIGCPNGCRLRAYLAEDGGVTVTGNRCGVGMDFARAELTQPMRSLTTSVKTVFSDLPVLPCRTAGEIPKEKIPAAMRALSALVIDRRVRCGEVILPNVAETGVDVIATLDL